MSISALGCARACSPRRVASPPARMQTGSRAVVMNGGPQHDDGVVLNLRVPELGAQQRRMKRQRAEQPEEDVEQMHTLVDQLAAPGELRAHPPFVFVA